MVTHVVLLKFRAGTPQAHLSEIVDSLRSLPSLVPQIREYTVGSDLGLASENAEIAVIAKFDDVDGYQAYSTHPDHRKVIEEQILPALETRSASQFM